MVKLTAKPCLSKILKQKGWTQLMLAEKTGLNQATISRFDRTTQRKDDHLFTIAYALGVKVEDLFEVTIEEEEKQ
ncbi:helix-turn-helix domain-containing protein [Thermoflavimicrobium daqui]|uniref:Transcriptional regulator n=1 Tax=Thermoflavimicrobium daqui TaxID=2137476 RepID=A0A364K0U7_9BACL|nr:helix-turn-helix transcriptional regulator [Thermoflavimicrobium daqui]RAL21318.1 transcriptional regulator [Thermoflavimicrobium daqui]